MNNIIDRMIIKGPSLDLFCKNIRFLSSKTEIKKWNSVVGLEIHAQISSESKLFSNGSTGFGNPVNSCCTFFDCAIPGTLPVINKKCVQAGILTSLALSCKLNECSLFDRKHYFYADLPSGYQITQQRKPLAVDGKLQFNVFQQNIHKEPYVKTSKIKQLQLEQDSGKSIYDDNNKRNLIDLNRAGVPLMEIVFEPDLSDGEEAAALVKELIIILKKLKTCSGKMEEGAVRVDANISVNKPNEPLGTRTEIKNIFSVRAVANAIKYEINRQINVLEKGGRIVNETLAWDVEKHKTISMRDKESKLDYRFMPEPNLPPLRIFMKNNDADNTQNLLNVNEIKSQLPTLPEKIRQCLITKYGLPVRLTFTMVNEEKLTNLFFDIINENPSRNPKTVANILVMEFTEFLNKYDLTLEDTTLSATQLGNFVDLLTSKRINHLILRNVFDKLRDDLTKMPEEIVKEYNWYQINDIEELTLICRNVINENPELLKKYKAGKKKILRTMFTLIIKKSESCANMEKVTNILEDLMK